MIGLEHYLAVAAALLSAREDTALPADTVVLGFEPDWEASTSDPVIR